MTFRILIDPKPLCAWGVGRGYFSISDLQLLSHPTEQTLLSVSTAITRAWVVSFQAGPDTNNHPGVPLYRSLWSLCDAQPAQIFPSVAWSCQATFVVSLHGPCSQLMLGRKGVVVQWNNFPSLFYLPTWLGEKLILVNMPDQILHLVAVG